MTRRIRLERLFAALGATVLIGACDARSASRHDAGAGEHSTPEAFFAELQKGRHLHFLGADELAQLADSAETIVLAEMTEFVEGKTVLGGSSIVAKVSVEETIRGSPKEHLYVEVLHAPIVKAEDLQELFVPFRGLWFLRDAFDNFSSPLDADRGRGVPVGEPLLGPVSGQGLVIEDPFAGLLQPLEPEHSAWLPELDSFQTLDDVAAAVPKQ
jgi:hypothetical protein